MPSYRISNGVMMSSDTSPTLHVAAPTPNYVELPEEPRPGKISPSTASGSSNSSPSPRASKSGTTTASTATRRRSSPEADEEEAIEEALPIVRSTLPSPSPKPPVERNGHAAEHHDRVDGNGALTSKPGYETKQQLAAEELRRDVDDDSCLIKCVYFSQQCCECTIV